MGIFRLAERIIGIEILFWVIRKLFMLVILIVGAFLLYGWFNHHIAGRGTAVSSAATTVVHAIGAAGREAGRAIKSAGGHQ